MYSGGAATALQVLDAYAAWINASESYADAILRYRQAEASALRWGTP
jgi:outer membrane protein TolC